MNERELLFALLRSEVCGEALDAHINESLPTELLEKLYNLAAYHDVAHLAGHALNKINALDTNEISEKFRERVSRAVYRFVRMEHEFSAICALLEEEDTPFIPLKGAVLCSLYPQAWMRTSCDIDILVEENHIEKATQALVDTLHYTIGERTYHDLSLHSPSNVHLELHHRVMDEAESDKFKPAFSRIWEESYQKEGSICHRCMSDEIFYFYHVAHMVKHFRKGGCGIKSFLDLWLLNHKVKHERKARERLLADGGLLAFENAAVNLSEVWFGKNDHDRLSIQLEEYVLAGGAYGNLKNNVSFANVKEGGRFRSLLAMVFPAYDVMKHHYPILQKLKWMLPVCHVLRCIQFVFNGRAKKLLCVLKTNAHISEEDISAAEALIEHLEL